MTQIVNSRFYRLGVNRTWEASWTTSKLLYTPYVTHDLVLFKYIKLFISQYSAPLYFRFPHTDRPDIEDSVTDNLGLQNKIKKTLDDIEIKDQKSQKDWQKKIKKIIASNETSNLIEIWLKKRRKMRIQKRFTDVYTKIKKSYHKKTNNNLIHSKKFIDISPQPPIETFAANPKKLSGNDRIVYNPFTKIGLIFSHLNILRQKALTLKIFISDYDSYEKINSLSKKYLRTKIKKRLKFLFKRKLNKNFYLRVKKFRNKSLIKKKLRKELMLLKTQKQKKSIIKINNIKILIKPQMNYKHTRVINRRKTIRKMIPRRLKNFMYNQDKFFTTLTTTKQLSLFTEKIYENSSHIGKFYTFIRRFALLNDLQQKLKKNPALLPIISNVINPMFTLAYSKLFLQPKILLSKKITNRLFSNNLTRKQKTKFNPKTTKNRNKFKHYAK